MALSKDEFETKCMDIIELIVGIDNRQTRTEAITIAQKMLSTAKEKTTNEDVLSIYQCVVNEFETASDAEYEALRKQIFG